jgi:hypothetical protein
MATLPSFNSTGDLPAGIYAAPLEEVIARFGKSTPQRRQIGERLIRIYTLAKQTGHLARFVVFGSFVTARPAPNDADVFMLMEDSFDASRVSGETAILFDHPAAQSYFGASVFWVRRLAAFGGEQATVEHWQIKRGGEKRGIVEVV